MLALPAVYLRINDSKMQAAGVSTVKAIYAIEVLKSPLCRVDPANRPFDGPKGWGFSRLIPLDELRTANSPYLANDRLLLRVRLAVNDTVAAE